MHIRAIIGGCVPPISGMFSGTFLRICVPKFWKNMCPHTNLHWPQPLSS